MVSWQVIVKRAAKMHAAKTKSVVWMMGGMMLVLASLAKYVKTGAATARRLVRMQIYHLVW
jgi:hypothetical protein